MSLNTHMGVIFHLYLNVPTFWYKNILTIFLCLGKWDSNICHGYKKNDDIPALNFKKRKKKNILSFHHVYHLQMCASENNIYKLFTEFTKRVFALTNSPVFFVV